MRWSNNREMRTSNHLLPKFSFGVIRPIACWRRAAGPPGHNRGIDGARTVIAQQLEVPQIASHGAAERIYRDRSLGNESAQLTPCQEIRAFQRPRVQLPTLPEHAFRPR